MGQPSLLHAMEFWGVPVEADYHSGEYGAYRVRLGSGRLRLCQVPVMEMTEGHTLACCVVPKTDIEIAL